MALKVSTKHINNAVNKNSLLLVLAEHSDLALIIIIAVAQTLSRTIQKADSEEILKRKFLFTEPSLELSKNLNIHAEVM